MDTPNHVFFPVSYNELFAVWNRFPAAVPYAGGTYLNNDRSVFICLEKIEELHNITRTEQYLDIGAMVKLNRLLQLGKIAPHVLYKCVENIAGVQVRNVATIGGNICYPSRLLDLPAPLTALDAQYELRNTQGSRWVLASRFHTEEQSNLDKQEILTRIRLPLHQWDYSIYKKFRMEGYFSGEALVFLARTQKNILTEIRVVYRGNTIIRNKDGETILNGKYLPLNRKNADEFVENWSVFLANKPNISNFSKNAILNTIEENVYNLTE